MVVMLFVDEKNWQPGGNEGPNDGEDNKPKGEIQKRFLSILTWMTGWESRLKTTKHIF